MVILHLGWIFLKLVRENELIRPSSYLDVLKIMMEMRGNDLNRQIYPYLKMNLQHWSMIKYFFCLFIILKKKTSLIDNN